MTKTKFGAYLFAFVAIITLMICGAIEGVKRQEIKECNQWQEQADTYPGFYLLDWQKEQCQAHGIEINFTFKTPELEMTTAILYAYSSEVCQTDDDPFTMASGKKVYKGAIACPSRFPYGTKVEYEGRVYTCEDRMAKRYRDGNYFDIWMPTREEALEFGRRESLVIIY